MSQASNQRAQQECRERFIVMFFEKGYGDKFEYVGGKTSSKGKAKLRCRICGNVFEKYGSFAQQGINIRCDKCHIYLNDLSNAPRDGKLGEHIAERYNNGDAFQEISDAFGIKKKYRAGFLREQGIEVVNRLGNTEKEKRRKKKEETKKRKDDERMAKEQQRQKDKAIRELIDTLKSNTIHIKQYVDIVGESGRSIQVERDTGEGSHQSIVLRNVEGNPQLQSVARAVAT